MDTEFHKIWAFLCTTSPIFPFFLMFEDLGEFGANVTKFAQVADNESMCYVNVQFGRNWWFLTTSSPKHRNFMKFTLFWGGKTWDPLLLNQKYCYWWFVPQSYFMLIALHWSISTRLSQRCSRPTSDGFSSVCQKLAFFTHL